MSIVTHTHTHTHTHTRGMIKCCILWPTPLPNKKQPNNNIQMLIWITVYTWTNWLNWNERSSDCVFLASSLGEADQRIATDATTFRTRWVFQLSWQEGFSKWTFACILPLWICAATGKIVPYNNKKSRETTSVQLSYYLPCTSLMGGGGVFLLRSKVWNKNSDTEQF